MCLPYAPPRSFREPLTLNTIDYKVHSINVDGKNTLVAIPATSYSTPIAAWHLYMRNQHGN